MKDSRSILSHFSEEKCEDDEVGGGGSGEGEFCGEDVGSVGEEESEGEIEVLSGVVSVSGERKRKKHKAKKTRSEKEKQSLLKREEVCSVCVCDPYFCDVAKKILSPSITLNAFTSVDLKGYCDLCVSL